MSILKNLDFDEDIHQQLIKQNYKEQNEPWFYTKKSSRNQKSIRKNAIGRTKKRPCSTLYSPETSNQISENSRKKRWLIKIKKRRRNIQSKKRRQENTPVQTKKRAGIEKEIIRTEVENTRNPVCRYLMFRGLEYLKKTVLKKTQK